MTSPLTADVLTIFWKGVEVPGFICYGYWPSSSQPSVAFPFESWPAGTLTDDTWLAEWRDGELEWRVLRRDVRVARWPAREHWPECVRRTLECFIESEVLLAWCATEGSFPDPPALFQPRLMEGGMWAVLGAGIPFECAARVDQPYSGLPTATLAAVHEVAEEHWPPGEPSREPEE